MKRVLFMLVCLAFIATADVNAQGTSINQTDMFAIAGGGASPGLLGAGISYGTTYRSYVRWSVSAIRAAIPPHTIIQNVTLNNVEPWSEISNGPTLSTYISFKILPSVSGGNDWTADYNAIGNGSVAASVLYTVEYYSGYYHLTSPSNTAISFSALKSTLQNIVNGSSNNDLIIGIQNQDEQNSQNFFSAGGLNFHVSINVTWNNVNLSLSAPTYVEPGNGAYYTISSVSLPGGSVNSQPDQLYSGTFPQGGDVTITAHGPTNTPGQTWGLGWTDGGGGNPRTINPSSNFNSGTRFKEIQHSTDVSAFTNNSQRKLVRTRDGWLHLVYTSGGRVWLEESTDGGSTWFLGNGGQPLDNGAGKCPSIDWHYNTSDPNNSNYNAIIVAWQQQSGSTYTIEYAVFKYTNGSYVRQGKFFS